MFRLLCLCLLTVFVSSPAWAGSRQLSGIMPVVEEREDRVPVAIAKMVLDHEGYPAWEYGKYQCGIVRTLSDRCFQNCDVCVFEEIDQFRLMDVMMDYPTLINQRRGLVNHPLTMSGSHKVPDEAEIIGELRDGHPLIIWIDPIAVTPTAVPHPVLIVGYDQGKNGTVLRILDPWPYANTGLINDPWRALGGKSVSLGEYDVPYTQDFIEDSGWYYTISQIERH